MTSSPVQRVGVRTTAINVMTISMDVFMEAMRLTVVCIENYKYFKPIKTNIAPFQIGLMDFSRFGSVWSRFYQFFGLGSFYCVLLIRNYKCERRSPPHFVKQI